MMMALEASDQRNIGLGNRTNTGMDDAHAHFIVAELFQALFHSFGAA